MSIVEAQDQATIHSPTRNELSVHDAPTVTPVNPETKGTTLEGHQQVNDPLWCNSVAESYLRPICDSGFEEPP